MDNVFIERLWRSLRYECVYLSEFTTGSEARTGIGGWMDGWTSTTGAGPTRRSTVGRPKRRTLATKLTGAWGFAPLRPAKRRLNHEGDVPTAVETRRRLG